MSKQIRKIAHKSFAGFMAVWLSGVVFLLCCGTMNAKPMDAEFCPLAKMSAHCDKANQANADSSFVEKAGYTAMDCCGFLPAVFDKTRKIERTQKQTAVTPKLAALKFTFPRLVTTSSHDLAFQARVPNKQRSFVINSVFRI